MNGNIDTEGGIYLLAVHFHDLLVICQENAG